MTNNTPNTMSDEPKIFGRDWKDIQDMQMGLYKPKTVSGPYSKPPATQADKNLLDKYGTEGLESMQYFGVLDRLRNSGLI